MKGGGVLLALLAAGAAWMLAGSSEASAATTDVSKRVANALATENPATMSAVAAQLRGEGEYYAAAQLEAAAAELLARQAVGGVLPPPPVGVPMGPEVVVSPGFPQFPEEGDGTPPEMAPEPEFTLPPIEIPVGLPGLPEVGPPTASLGASLLAIGDPEPGAPLLRKGSKGSRVTAWQKVLLALNPVALPRFGADGDFGSETEGATRLLQGSANALYARAGLPLISVDGVVGPQTRTAASRLLEVRGGNV
jgi:hypothetical protein